MSLSLITSYQHLLNCGTSHDSGDKLPICMNEQTIWVIRSPYVHVLVWLGLVSRSHLPSLHSLSSYSTSSASKEFSRNSISCSFDH